MFIFLDTVAVLPEVSGMKNLLFIGLMALFVILGCVAVIIRNNRLLKNDKSGNRESKEVITVTVDTEKND